MLSGDRIDDAALENARSLLATATNPQQLTKTEMNKSDYIFGIRAIIGSNRCRKKIDKVLMRRELGGDLGRELSSKAAWNMTYRCRKYPWRN